jgi:hypothetical protein
MSHSIINHVEIGLGRRATQYYESAKFISFLEALLAYSDELELALDSVSLQSDIDIARGANLDTIGEIVGVSRIIPNSLALEFFGFDDSIPTAFRFGEEGSPSLGRRFRNEGEPSASSTILDDIEYRNLIRAKIVKNHSHGTGEDVIKALQFLFDVNTVTVTDNLNMTFTYIPGRELNFSEQSILALDIVPRPAGVQSILGTYVPPGTLFFGFTDTTPTAETFGEEGFPGGGIFREEF